MRGISYRHLARVAAANISDGACSGQGELWSECESALRESETTQEAIAAVRPALKFCHDCPALDACREWAVIDSYTGIAAGAVYSTGHALPPGSRIRRGRPGRLADVG